MAKPPPPPTPAKPPQASSPAPRARTFNIQRGITLAAHKVVVYGPGGIGKSELCALLGSVGVEPLILDLDMETAHLDVTRVAIEEWDELLAALRQKDLWGKYGAVVIDSATKAEEYDVSWVLANVPHEKKHAVQRLEDYGWGKGYSHVYETFLLLLQELDAIVRAGLHVVLTAHDCVANVPNPSGEDWIRYEPRLQNTKQGSIRLRVKEWATHLLFLGYDVAPEDGKGKGSGTRTIYPTERPTHMAKSRTLSEAIPYTQGDAELWRQMFRKETT